MKRLNKYILILCLLLSPLLVSAEEIDLIVDNNEDALSIQTDAAQEETPLYDIQLNVKDEAATKKEPQKAYIDYNYLNERTPLLSKYTKYTSETGILKSFDPSFVYQGYFDMNMTKHEDNHLFYENALVDVNLSGKFRAPVEFKSQFNLLSKGHENYFHKFFKDQYVAFTAIPHNKIFLGNFRTPVGKEGSASSYTLPLINRSQLAKNFSNIRAIGTKVEGKYDLVNYRASVTSSDRDFHEFFPGVDFSGWTDFKPLGKTDGRWGELEIGGGLNYGKRHYDYMVVSSAISYKYKKIGFFAEYGISDGANGSKGLTDKKAQSVVLTATYNITKKLQLVGRYDIFDPDRHTSHNTITEYTAGINYLIKGSALKFMLNYIYRQMQAGADSNRILAGIQVIL